MLWLAVSCVIERWICHLTPNQMWPNQLNESTFHVWPPAIYFHQVVALFTHYNVISVHLACHKRIGWVINAWWAAFIICQNVFFFYFSLSVQSFDNWPIILCPDDVENILLIVGYQLRKLLVLLKVGILHI